MSRTVQERAIERAREVGRARYVDGSVESMRVSVPGGEWIVKMSRPWRPPATGARPPRLLVVIDEADIDVGGDRVQMDEADGLMQPMPELEPVHGK